MGLVAHIVFGSKSKRILVLKQKECCRNPFRKERQRKKGIFQIKLSQTLPYLNLVAGVRNGAGEEEWKRWRVMLPVVATASDGGSSAWGSGGGRDPDGGNWRWWKEVREVLFMEVAAMEQKERRATAARDGGPAAGNKWHRGATTARLKWRWPAAIKVGGGDGCVLLLPLCFFPVSVYLLFFCFGFWCWLESDLLREGDGVNGCWWRRGGVCGKKERMLCC